MKIWQLLEKKFGSILKLFKLCYSFLEKRLNKFGVLACFQNKFGTYGFWKNFGIAVADFDSILEKV